MAGVFPTAAAAAALTLIASLLGAGGSATAVTEPAALATDVQLGQDVLGRSRALATRLALPAETVDLTLDWNGNVPADAWYRWVPDLGTPVGTSATPLAGSAPRAPDDAGVYRLEVGWTGGGRTFDQLRLVVVVPFQHDGRGTLEGYRIGRYPLGRTGRYAPPAGFIKVTPDNASLQLSRHFRLSEFLTHDQADVWPKFAVVDPLLLDKLELVFDELNASGVRAERMVVMSGFRTPQYNQKGLDQGRAQLSRHQYGDAADVWVDNDGDWYMDDLNGDGRRDTRDVRVLLAAVARVEARHPELVGGAGVYTANGAHGPFLHVDVRGVRARW